MENQESLANTEVPSDTESPVTVEEINMEEIIVSTQSSDIYNV
jgi:hypothetical protein